MATLQRYAIPAYQVRLVRERTVKVSQERVEEPRTAAELVQSCIGLTDREHLVAVLLDAQRHIIGVNTVSVGTLDSSLVHPREVFKPAILSNAHAVILGHNHPGGDPEPSPEDVAVTRQIAEAGKLLGIEVLDHVIVTFGGAFYSMKEHNRF